MKILTTLLTLFLCFTSCAWGEIIKIQNILEVLPQIDCNTLVLLDLDDTLTDSSISLGSGAWRKYIRKKIPEYEKARGKSWGDSNLHDLLSLYVANKVNVKPVEEKFPQLVADLQNKKIPVFVFTARGKTQWYETHVNGIHDLTKQQLQAAGFDFSLTVVPEELKKIDPSFYENGVIFSNPLKKGIFLKDHLLKTGYHPSKIVFVDDKLDQVQSMQKATENLNIPFIGFWYTRAEKNHQNFDPLIATIQLKELLEHSKVISDQEALFIKNQQDTQDPDVFFYRFLDSLDISQLKKFPDPLPLSI